MICLGLEGYFRCLSCLYFLSFLVCAWVSIINVEKSSSLFLIFFLLLLFSSVIPNACRLLFSHSVVPDSLWPHGLQHAKLPCPLVSPTVLSNSCPSNWWCHSTILSSVIPFSRLPSVFPTSGLFKRVRSLHQVAKLLEFQLQSFQWIFRTDFL